MNPKIIEKARASMREDAANHEEAEKLKVGTFRVGNTGLIVDGKNIGNCQRQTYLRWKGTPVRDITDDRAVMFAGGHMNEEVWWSWLSRHFAAGELAKEGEITVSWKTAAGYAVEGHPDMVIRKLPSGKPLWLVEHKMASSIWTSRSVRFEGKPKFSHLAQAAHYMWLLEVEGTLTYTQYVDFPILGWAQAHFPKQGEWGSELIEYNDKGKAKKCLPYIYGYDLRWDPNGTLEYKSLKDDWQTTIITIAGIKEYYETAHIPAIEEAPANLDADGKAASYSLCDYCPLKPTCRKAEAKGASLQDWEDAVVLSGHVSVVDNSRLTVKK